MTKTVYSIMVCLGKQTRVFYTNEDLSNEMCRSRNRLVVEFASLIVPTDTYSIKDRFGLFRNLHPTEVQSLAYISNQIELMRKQESQT